MILIHKNMCQCSRQIHWKFNVLQFIPPNLKTHISSIMIRHCVEIFKDSGFHSCIYFYHTWNEILSLFLYMHQGVFPSQTTSKYYIIWLAVCELFLYFYQKCILLLNGFIPWYGFTCILYANIVWVENEMGFLNVRTFDVYS